MGCCPVRRALVVGLGAILGTGAIEAQAPTPLRRANTRGLESSLMAPRSVAVGHDGRVFVGDEEPARVVEFDSMGRFVRQIGREGSGPGEFRSPIVGAGRTLVVNDPQLSRLSAFDSRGALLWTRPGACCRGHPVHVDRRGRIFVLAAPLTIGGVVADSEATVVFSPDGHPTDTLWVPGLGGRAQAKSVVTEQYAFSVRVPFVSGYHHAITDAGGVVFGESGSPELVEIGPDGRRRRTPMPWVSRALTTAARQAARAAAVEDLVKLVDRSVLEGAIALSDVPNRAPHFFGLRVDRCGRYWVLRTSAAMGGLGTTFDVVVPGAKPITLQLEDLLLEPGPRWAVGDAVVAAIVDDPDGPSLAVYQLPRSLRCTPGH